VGDQTVSSWTNSEDSVALDGVDEVDKIRQADKLADQGAASGDLGPIKGAMVMRPNDWTYYEQAAAVSASNGNDGYTSGYMASSDLIVEQATHNQKDCERLRISQLRARVDAIKEQMQRIDPNSGPYSTLENNLVYAQNELNSLLGGGTSTFCG
jgi:hypothetical protein